MFMLYAFFEPSSAVTVIVILLSSPAFNSSLALLLITAFALASSSIGVIETVLTLLATVAS